MYDWQHYIPLLALKPGSLRNGAPFREMPEQLCRLQLHLLKHEGGDRLMANLLSIVPIHGLEILLIAVDLAFEAGLPSTEHIVNIILRLKPTPADDEVFDGPTLKQPALANVERYDALLAKEQV